MMLHNKYQGSRPCDFRKEDFISARKIIFSLYDVDMQQTSIDLSDQSFMMFISMVKIAKVPLNTCNKHRKLNAATFL